MAFLLFEGLQAKSASAQHLTHSSVCGLQCLLHYSSSITVGYADPLYTVSYNLVLVFYRAEDTPQPQ